VKLELASPGYERRAALWPHPHRSGLSGGRLRLGAEFENLPEGEAGLLVLLLRLKQS
jgi:hypothetical protein